MPRSVEEILQHAAEMAERFESYEPVATRTTPAQELSVVRGR